MNHDLFDWDFENISHIARHGVSPEETEEVLLGMTKELGMREEGGELRFSELGLTSSGRLLFVAWTPRDDRMRVVTAFVPGASLRSSFIADLDMFTIPHFENEADEAKWLFENQDLIAAEYERVKPALSSGAAKRKLMELRAEKSSDQNKDLQSAKPTVLPKTA